ncbi:MAG: hypothetical protein EOP65_17010 [Sphingomonas sp.]|nr:MAG: hypothetical protein EOP65_17010 [Sphingomonas sp.]
MRGDRGVASDVAGRDRARRRGGAGDGGSARGTGARFRDRRRTVGRCADRVRAAVGPDGGRDDR